MNSSDRYEVNHQGQVVVAESNLCANIDGMLVELFSQYGHQCDIRQKEGSCRIIELKDVNGKISQLYVYSGTIRNESRNQYEKKMQLGKDVDPRKRDLHKTIILGIYVFDKSDTSKDAVFVGFPVDEGIRYDTNPSVRGVYVHKILATAKSEGFVYDPEHNIVGFRSEFIYYYLQNYYKLHYENKQFGTEATTEFQTEHIQKKSFHLTNYPHNRIFFGAPGTGKSFNLNLQKDELLSEGGEYERVTFHPDYSYANFVGTYKPVPYHDDDGKDAITYAYVPGPFMRTYVKAIRNGRSDDVKPFLLIIEEINRANVAAVFGDVFQLLDRNDDNVSEYPIQATEDIKKYLADQLKGCPGDYSEIRIPANMFIWATMNSADQGVFPMDTAFKRRWDFDYIGIDDSEATIIDKKVALGQGEYRRIVEWNTLRKAINNELLTYKVNEDKLMGPYFISKKDLPDGKIMDSSTFGRVFKNKVLMYLFDDAAKQKRPTLFAGCEEYSKNQYSKICNEFDTKGVCIFCEAIRNQFIDRISEAEEE